MRLERVAELGKLLLCFVFVLRKNYKLQIVDLTRTEVNIRKPERMRVRGWRGRVEKGGRKRIRELEKGRPRET